MEIIKTDELKNADSEYLANEAVKQLLEKKALDVKLFNVEGKTSVTDFYVNATGRSSTQVAALSDDVCELIGNEGRDPLRVEGRAGNAWILVDYGDVIVHIFNDDTRLFYHLERLWGDGENLEKYVDPDAE